MNKNSSASGGKKSGGNNAHTNTANHHNKNAHYVKRGQRNYLERTTTVRFLSASSGLSYCTKLIKVQKTKAKAEDDSCLCAVMQEKGSCPRGDQCPLVHVAPEDLWLFIHPQSHPVPGGAVDHLVYSPGFYFTCFSADFNLYYDALPSQVVVVTEGSKRFIDIWNESGANMREKFKLCPTYERSGFCTNGARCEDLHAVADLLETAEAHQTHIGTADAMAHFHYPRLPADVRVKVLPLPTSVPGGKKRAEKEDEQRHQQLLQQQADTIYSGADVLVTEGATRYEEEFRKNRCEVPETSKFQNCVHFVQNQMCRKGALCSFLHIVPVALAVSATLTPAPEPKAREASETGQRGPAKALREAPRQAEPNQPNQDCPEPFHSQGWPEGCALAEPKPFAKGCGMNTSGNDNDANTLHSLDAFTTASGGEAHSLRANSGAGTIPLPHFPANRTNSLMYNVTFNTTVSTSMPSIPSFPSANTSGLIHAAAPTSAAANNSPPPHSTGPRDATTFMTLAPTDLAEGEAQSASFRARQSRNNAALKAAEAMLGDDDAAEGGLYGDTHSRHGSRSFTGSFDTANPSAAGPVPSPPHRQQPAQLGAPTNFQVRYQQAPSVTCTPKDTPTLAPQHRSPPGSYIIGAVGDPLRTSPTGRVFVQIPVQAGGKGGAAQEAIAPQPPVGDGKISPTNYGVQSHFTRCHQLLSTDRISPTGKSSASGKVSPSGRLSPSGRHNPYGAGTSFS